MCGAAGRMCESRVGPISFGWSQIDDGHMVGCLWLWVGLVPSVVSVVVVASFHYKSSGVTIVLERLSNMFSFSVSGKSKQIFLARSKRVQATATLCAKG